MEENKTSVLYTVEGIQNKLENMQGLMRVCSAAFSHKSIDCMSADDICGTFESVHDQLEELTAMCADLVIAITDNKAVMKS